MCHRMYGKSCFIIYHYAILAESSLNLLSITIIIILMLVQI